jgi:putative holliday junction resolvase
MRYIGLDIGDKRIGVALSDPTGLLATPLKIIKRRDDATDIAAIVKLVAEHKAGMAIAGLPVSLGEFEGLQAVKVRCFADKLQQSLTISLAYQDERYSTADARMLLREAGAKPKRLKQSDDAAAAAVILQAFLDEHRK